MATATTTATTVANAAVATASGGSNVLSGDFTLTQAMKDAAEKKGMLKKQGIIRKSWKTRFFVLHGSFLYYLAKPTDTKPKGVISLEGATVKENSDAKIKKTFCSVINSKQSLTGKARFSDRAYYIVAANAAEQKEWNTAIQAAIDRAASPASPRGQAPAQVAVFGATGTVGAEVVKVLLARNIKTLVLVRDEAKAVALKAAGATVVGGVDVDRPETLAAVPQLRGVAAAFLLSGGIAGTVQQGKNMVDACLNAGVKYLVRLSAMGADGTAPSAADGGSVAAGRLPAWHSEVEKYIAAKAEASGAGYTFLRPNMFMTNIAASNPRLRERGADTEVHTITLSIADGRVSFVAVSDIAEAAATVLAAAAAGSAAQYAKKAYTLTGPEALSGADVATQLGTLLGRSLTYTPLEAAAAKPMFEAMTGGDTASADALVDLMTVAKSGGFAPVTGDLEQLLGRRPTALAQYLRDNQDKFAPRREKPLVLVCTANGNVGSATVHALQGQSCRVRAAVRAGRITETLREQAAEVVEMELDNPANIAAALQGVERVFFAVPLTEKMPEYADALIEAIRATPSVKLVVKLSGSLGAPGSGGADICLSKWHGEAERKIQALGRTHVFVRANSFYQNIGNYYSQSIREFSLIAGPFGDGKVSYVDARDVGAVVAEALMRDNLANRTLDLNGAEALSHREIADIITDVVHAGTPVKFVDVTSSKYKEAMRAYMPEVIIDSLNELYNLYRSGTLASTNGVVEEILGRKPISFRRYVQDYSDLFRSPNAAAAAPAATPAATTSTTTTTTTATTTEPAAAGTTTAAAPAAAAAAAPEKLVIFAANGNIGAPTIDALVAKGLAAHVRAVVRSAKSAGELRAKGVEVVEADLSDAAAVGAALKGATKVFFNVPLSPAIEEQINVLLAALKAEGAGIKHIVKLSAAGIDGGQIALAKWHLAGENGVKALGVNYTFVRPNSFHQNIGAFFAQPIKAGFGIAAPFGTGKVAYVDARDVGAVVAEALTRDDWAGKTLDLNGPDALDHQAIADTVAKVAGYDVKYTDQPEEAYRAAVGPYLPPVVLDALCELYMVYRNGWAGTAGSDVEKLLGRPAISFQRYVEDNAALFKRDEAAAAAAAATTTSSEPAAAATTTAAAPAAAAAAAAAPEKLVIFAANGNIGAPAIDALVAKGLAAHVRAVVRSAGSAEQLRAKGVEVVEADLSDAAAVGAALKGATKVFFNVPLSPVMEDQINVLLAALKAEGAGIKHVVKLSAVGIDGGQIALAKWHLAGENGIKALGVNYTFVRPNSFHQNIGAFFAQPIKAGYGIAGPFGTGKVAYVDARDVGAVVAEALTRDDWAGKTLDLNGPDAFDHQEIADAIGKLAGYEVKYTEQTEEAYRAAVGPYLPPVVLDALCELYTAYRNGWAGTAGSDVEKLLGRPAISFQRYVEDNAALFKRDA